MKRTLVLAVAVFAAVLLPVSGGAGSHRAARGLTPAKAEQLLVHPGGGQGWSYELPGGVIVGPTLAAACRGEGAAEGFGTAATYYRLICAARVRNAKRLLIVRVVLPTPA
jgi:hypothetical protein